MSKTIDEKVVSMQFDNKQFETNVRTSMSTIDKLKQSLNFKGASKGLENVNAAAKNVNMSGLAGGIETVKAKFSALEVIGVTALANITNSAINAGKRIVSALTIDPIKTGLQEYETKMNAIQVIKANTRGKNTMDEITAALDDLNDYADKTIYNFAQMTSNIGKFTAQGLDVNEAKEAVKGMANLAAASGASAEDMARATYQMSQALSGTIKMIDWNSLRNANMATTELKNTLIDLAKVHGIAIDEMIEKEGSFEQTLSKGWLTGEMFTEAMNIYSGVYSDAELKAKGFTDSQIANFKELAEMAESAATEVKTFTQLWDVLKETAQSGWTQTWELIFGDFETAKKMFTKLQIYFSDIINGWSDARNTLLGGALKPLETWNKIKEKLNNSSGLNKIKEVANSIENVTDKLEYFQKVVNDVWRGDYKNSDTGRFELLEKAGYDHRVVQDLVNKGYQYKLTIEDIEESHKKFGLTIENTSKSTEKTAESFGELTDEKLKDAGLTEAEIKLYRDLEKEANRTGITIQELVDKMSKKDGRTLLIESVKNAWKGLVSILKSVRDAWVDIFPPMTAVQLYSIISRINEFSQKLVVSGDTAKKLKRTFKGLFAILDIIRTAIGGAFTIAFKIAKKILSMFNLDILDVTASIGDALVKFHDWVFENSIFAKALEKTVSIIARAIKKIKEWFNAFKNLPKVQNALTKFRSVCSQTVSDVSEYFKGGIDRINAFIDRIKAMDSITLDDLDDIFRDFKDNVIDYFLDIDGRFEDIKEAFRSFKESAKQHLTEAGNKFDWLKDKILGFSNAVKDKISSNIGMGEILTVGIGAGLIFFVKKIGDALETIAGPIGEIAEVVTNFNGVLKGLQKVLNAFAMKTKAEALLKIAFAIAVLAGSIALLTLLDPGKMWSAIGAIGALAAILLILATAMNFLNKNTMSISKEGIKKTSSSLLGIAAALGVLVLALKVMDSLDAGKMKSNLGILGIMAAGLVAVAIILNDAAPDLTKESLTLISIAVALKIMVSALSDLEKINIENIIQTIGLFSLLVTGLSVLALAAKGLGFGSGVAILAIVIALKLLVSAFNDIAGINAEQIKSNINAFIAIFGTFAALMIASIFAGKNAAKAGVGILAMSAALILIIAAIKMLAKMSPSDLKKGLKAVSQLLLIFGAVVALSFFAGENAAKSGAMLLVMAGAMLMLTAVIVVLSHVDAAGLKRALGAITILELVFGALIAITRFAGEADKIRGTIVILAVTIGIMAIALGALSMINPDNLKSATTAISTVIGMFALLVASTHFMQKAVVALAILAATVLALGGILYLLAGLPVESTLGAAAAFSVLLLSLSAACAIISHIPITGAVTGALGLSAFIGIMAALLAILGGLAQIPGLEWLISEGGDFLQKIGTALGQFVGGIVGGFGVGMSAGLPEIATNLSDFMTKLQPFIDGARLIDESAMNGIKALAETILILCGANLLDAITSWITGGSSLADFAAQLVPFGEAMANFSAKVAGNIDEEAVTAAANAGKIMADFADTIPNSGGVLGFFAGENDMAAFGAQLFLFGAAIVGFSSTVAGNVDKDSVQAAADAGKMMTEFANTIPNCGGVLSFFTGGNDLALFGAQLLLFGTAITSFSSIVAGNINSNAIGAAKDAGSIMSELAQTLPEDPSIWERIMGGGQQSLGDFAQQLPPFGEGIKSFSDSLGDSINVSAVRAAATAGKTMAEMVSELDGTENVSILSELSSELPTFGQAMVDFSSKVNDMKTSSLSSNVSKFKEVVKTLTDISKSGLNEFVKNFKVGETKAISSINKLLSSMITIIKAKGLIFASLGKGLMVNFARGIHSNKTSLSNAFSKNLESAITTIKNYYNKFYSAGAYVVMGFVNGIDANTYKAEGKAAAMALKAEASAKAALNAHSPSKKFYKVGTYAGMGFVNALDDYGSESYKAGFAMADNARVGLSKAISTVRDLIDNGMDDQLTIRPVLDLSNITSGANQLNGLFNTNPSVGLLSNVRSVSSMMNRNQNGANDDVISAIKDLGSKINASSGDTYSINGITYDDGSNVSEAVKTLTRAVKMGRRT